MPLLLLTWNSVGFQAINSPLVMSAVGILVTAMIATIFFLANRRRAARDRIEDLVRAMAENQSLDLEEYSIRHLRDLVKLRDFMVDEVLKIQSIKELPTADQQSTAEKLVGTVYCAWIRERVQPRSRKHLKCQIQRQIYLRMLADGGPELSRFSLPRSHSE